MIVLGISGGVRSGNQDGAAAILVNGRLIAAAEEERLSGIKFANGLLPRRAVASCLAQAGVSIREVDCVVYPGATYRGIEDILRRYFDFHFGFAPPVRLVDHHEAHAASTYFGSGFDHALVVTFDFSGDGKSTTVRAARGGRFDVLKEFDKPDSLGVFYSTVTQYLGFQKDSDEYKVMGMAAYGQPRYDLSHVLEITADGYRLHHGYLRGMTKDTPAPSKHERLFDRFPLDMLPRTPGAPIETRHYDVAASAQRLLEEAVCRLVSHYAERTGLDRVCLAGGVALNCRMNQFVGALPEVRGLYVPPVASDAGLALGGAYLVAHEAGEKVGPLEHAYWGPEFDADTIRTTLDRAGVDYHVAGDPIAEAVERIATGRIVGWFQGRMEYGPRALGNRSILADPRRAEMKDLINAKVKFREEFRPIAPAVLHDEGANFFAHYTDSPYMTRTFDALPAAVEQAPAIVHVDGTARLQSVHRETNPRFHELIRRFAEATGVPMVVNTSLNAYNDPIACEPFQAMRTFFATGLDALILGDFVLDKPRR